MHMHCCPHCGLTLAPGSQGLPEPLLRGVYAYGLTTPTALQRDAVAAMATGGGVVLHAAADMDTAVALALGVCARVLARSRGARGGDKEVGGGASGGGGGGGDQGRAGSSSEGGGSSQRGAGGDGGCGDGGGGGGAPESRPRPPLGLVLCPTREKALNFERLFAHLLAYTAAACACVVRGEGGWAERRDAALARGVDVVVATPASAAAAVAEGRLPLGALAVFAVDEADETLERGELLTACVACARVRFCACVRIGVCYCLRAQLTPAVCYHTTVADCTMFDAARACV
jgi:hypothetical protein